MNNAIIIGMKFEAIKTTPSAESVDLSEAEKQEKIVLINELEKYISDIETSRFEIEKAVDLAEKSKDWSGVFSIEDLLKRQLSNAKIVQRKIEGKGEELTISAEYKYKDEKGNEVRENIELDFETEFSSAVSLYERHDISQPANFKEEMQVVWAENIEAIKEAMAEKGFDKVLFLPENLPNLKELDKKMTAGYKENFEKENPGKTGSETYWGEKADSITEVIRTGIRMVLVHKAPDLTAQPELKKTLDKKYGGEKESGKDNKAEDFIKAGEALTATEYLILQRDIFEKTGIHIDSKKSSEGYIYVTWLPGSRVGSRVVRAGFNPDGGRVSVSASDADSSLPEFGCRPSRCFFKK